MSVRHEDMDLNELSRFQRLQVEHFACADEAKFLWQTTNPYLASTERALLDRVSLGSNERLLEVGCGEGGNLRLMEPASKGAVGVDFSHAKIGWARRHIAEARFVCADAGQLPFRNESFDVVLCRDVLHHVVDKVGVLAEVVRVCRTFGRIVIIEPNGRSPIMWLLGLLVRAERDLMRNSFQRLEALLERQRIAETAVTWAQPFPFGRVLFHYRWGLPRLSLWLGKTVLAVEQVIGRMVPSDRWAYIIITTIKPASRKPMRA
jgi:ubiquinone/menaquinone biosynthesis C-methylase UbiE